jgi:polysaccharide export outer membrane protein
MKRMVLFLLSAGLAGAIFVPAGAQAPPAASAEEEYRLGPEDVVQIQVWKRADLSGPVAVDYNGKLQLPLLGEIAVQEKTQTELGELLTARYRLLDPSIPEVLVTITGYNSRSITVVGEVRNPGKYGARTMPALWSAILTAGGATPAADLAKVQVVRHDAVEGEPPTITVDLSRGIDDPATGPLPELRPKDTIIVPSLEANVVSGDKFQVLGAVRTPGTYRWSGVERVVEALSMSGGPLPDADLKRVRLTRPTSQGAISYQLDLQGYLYEAQPSADLALKPGDTVVVPSRKSMMARALDQVLRLAPVVSVAASLAWLTK